MWWWRGQGLDNTKLIDHYLPQIFASKYILEYFELAMFLYNRCNNSKYFLISQNIHAALKRSKIFFNVVNLQCIKQRKENDVPLLNYAIL